MEITLLKSAMGLSLGLFFLSKKSQHLWSTIGHFIVLLVTSMWAIRVMTGAGTPVEIPFLSILGVDQYLFVDQLSAFFVLVINLTCFTGILYARGYLQAYWNTKSKSELALHYFSFFWLHVSMLLVVLLRQAVAFLVAWELMSLASFFLVVFESEKKETIKIGINYLIQMHVGVVFIMAAFFLAYWQSGGEFGFDGLALYFQQHPPFFLFLLFFIGFGIKAGFIPLHTWLPHAHPAAPSHVSGVMSGVMIKMGIYGILRVLSFIHHDLYPIGMFVLGVSIFSGILGVSLAIVQHDIKKLLAYHSIENIGIIGISIGLGIIGLANNYPYLTVLGFGGGLLHILNHSLFKSLLFYSAGSVYQQTHTRNIEHMGGLIKRMPRTALFFLLGALAISGLPPFNGFISEFLIYSGMFKSLHAADLSTAVVLLFGFCALAIIGGLAIFCFTKVFSIVFLGNPRTSQISNANEVQPSMLIAYTIAGFFIVVIGVAPFLLSKPLSGLVAVFYTNSEAIGETFVPLGQMWKIVMGLVLLSACLWWLRRRVQQKYEVKEGPVWGCGYTGANPAVHQYTATSYADNFVQLSSKVVQVKKESKEFSASEIFPGERQFETHSDDIFEKYLVDSLSSRLVRFFEKIAVFQTGKIQHYLLYALVFILLVFLLTYLNWI